MSISMSPILDQRIKRMISERLELIDSFNESLGQEEQVSNQEEDEDGIPHLDFTASIDIHTLKEELQALPDESEEEVEQSPIDSSAYSKELEVKLSSLKDEAEQVSSTVSKMLDKFKSKNPKINEHLDKIKKILTDYIDKF